MEAPSTRYLEHDGRSIAWQVFGKGPAEILIVPGWISHVDLLWRDRHARAFLTELGEFARVAVYDKPGTGPRTPLRRRPR